MSDGDHTDLLVIGAGPYGVAAAAHARDRGIETTCVGRPMSLWREHMPADMYLRSGPDWHLDGNDEVTFEAYFAARGLDPADHDPIPIATFLDHTDWFLEQKGLVPEDRTVTSLAKPNGHFVATFEDGGTLTADKVLAAPGIKYFTNLPGWAEQVAPERRSHTCDLVGFDDLVGARVAIIGGRQSAYEWAALLCDHGAATVDVVHRHDTPAFEKVSWAFVDEHVVSTEATRGWWRSLSPERQQEIAGKFWQVGRLTLEHWIAPRLKEDVVTSRPGCEVVGVEDGDEVRLTLSDGTVLAVDHVVFASGYVADLSRVPYLEGVLDKVSVTGGFPDLSPGMETTLPGLYMTGFSATRDFGPFYGFTKGCSSAARIVVKEMLDS